MASDDGRAEARALDLTLVVPCYDEASHLRESVRAVLEVLDTSRFDYELLFVDDCSRDETRDIIRDICARSPRCRFVFHPANRGRGAAFKTGFASSAGRVTGFIDIDLEVPAHYIPALVTLVDRHGHDVAIGRRFYLVRQTGALHRIVLSFAYRAMCRVLLNTGVRDTETGCKFFKRSTTSDVVLGSEADGWFWDTEVMSLAALNNLRIFEMPVLFLRRDEKASTVRIVPDSLVYLRELYRFRGRAGLGMMDRSPIYWSPRVYDLVMRLLYRAEHEAVYEKVARLIPAGSSVVDVCCGTAKLYSRLRGRDVDYLGLDANGHFVTALRRSGVAARRFDLLHADVPAADYVVMCSSLYHFRAREGEVLGKLRRAARRAVIVSEPVRNLSSHKLRPLATLAGFLSNPGTGGSYRFRYDAAAFRSFATEQGASRIELEPGARNGLAVFEPVSSHPEVSIPKHARGSPLR